jgi:hypothetical protein
MLALALMAGHLAQNVHGKKIIDYTESSWIANMSSLLPQPSSRHAVTPCHRASVSVAATAHNVIATPAHKATVNMLRIWSNCDDLSVTTPRQLALL